jgi:prenylcysteine alpha-carboxyl methylesterase
MQIQVPIRDGGEENPLRHVASTNLETTPLFPTNGGIRRRTASESSISSHIMSPRRSFGREVQHAAEETFLLTRLTLTLLRYLG